MREGGKTCEGQETEDRKYADLVDTFETIGF